MAAMMRRPGDGINWPPHFKNEFCVDFHCEPIDESKSGWVKGPTRYANGARFESQYHTGVHKRNVGCDQAPKCIPAAPPTATEEVKMRFKFTIETRYITGAANERKGWKYTLRWEDPASNDVNKVHNYEHRYGYDSREAAKRAAEKKAREIAPTLLPVQTYEFTVDI